MFEYNVTVRLCHTDAAGILYFPQIYELVQEAFEVFIAERGISLYHLIHESPVLLPIVHSEADYEHPMRVGDALVVTLTPERIGVHAFTIAYDVRLKDGTLVARAKLVHCAMDRVTQKPVELPDDIRTALAMA